MVRGKIVKKILPVLAVSICAILCVGTFAGCGGSNINKLIVGFDQEYPPYGYIGSDGQPTGFDIELAKEVAKRNNWQIECKAIDWDSKDAELSSGTINCIWNGFTREGRENQYSWSDSYMLNKQVIVVKESSPISSEGDLAGKRVLTQTGSAALDALESDDYKTLTASFSSLDKIGDYNNAFMQLQSGLSDAVACDSSIASYQMAANPNQYKVAVTLTSEHYAVGVKKGNDDLAKKITDTLKKMNEDGFVKTLCEKYADQGISYDNWCLGK